MDISTFVLDVVPFRRLMWLRVGSADSRFSWDGLGHTLRFYAVGIMPWMEVLFGDGAFRAELGFVEKLRCQLRRHRLFSNPTNPRLIVRPGTEQNCLLYNGLSQLVIYILWKQTTDASSLQFMRSFPFIVACMAKRSINRLSIWWGSLLESEVGVSLLWMIFLIAVAFEWFY